MSKDIKTFSKPLKPYISHSMIKPLDTWHILVPRTHPNSSRTKPTRTTTPIQGNTLKNPIQERFIPHNLLQKSIEKSSGSRDEQYRISGPLTTRSTKTHPRSYHNRKCTSYTLVSTLTTQPQTIPHFRLSAECGIKFRSNHGKTHYHAIPMSQKSHAKHASGHQITGCFHLANIQNLITNDKNKCPILHQLTIDDVNTRIIVLMEMRLKKAKHPNSEIMKHFKHTMLSGRI